MTLTKFKDNWNKVDETCPTCNNITKKVIGLNKQNLKRLFMKPTLQDITIFLLLITCLYLYWANVSVVTQYNDLITNPQKLYSIYSQSQMFSNQDNINEIDLENIIFNPEEQYG